MRQKTYIPYVMGFIVGAAVAGLSMADKVTAARDHEARVIEQYRDCKVVGDLPTTADMLTEESGQ